MNVLETIESYGLVPVAVINRKEHAVPTAKALVDGGLPLIEVTMRTSSALDCIREIAQNLPQMLVGAGTVLTLEACKKAVEAGAAFIVAPGFNDEIVGWCCDNGVPVIPGVATPTELEHALSYGLKTLKFFPANIYGGISGCAALYGPYKSTGVKFLPTGGVHQEDLAEYISKPFISAVGGSWICKSSDIDSENFEVITAKTKEAIRALLGFRLAHVGINGTTRQETTENARRLAAAFDFGLRYGSSSVFPSEELEFLYKPGRGTHGHIGIKTNSIPRALHYLEQRGFKADPASFKHRGDTLVLAYLQEEISGFAIHLINE
jgi:2-dehydro-3-deoxyphosphogluconate aldolase/(4S)-4-hydroxy-2-oxoglutarate aldolase